MKTTDKLDRMTLLWVIVGATVVRVLWALFVPVVPISDSVGYDAFARTLAEHYVFGWTKDEPFAFWPPGTSFLHGIVYSLFGVHHEAIVAFNIIVSMATILTSVRVAERLFNERVALWTAVILAVWPTLVMYCTVIASELPYILFSILALDVWTSNGSIWKRAIVAGLLIGIAALIRPLALLLPAVYAGAILVQQRFDRQTFLEQLRLGIGALIAMTVLIAPWTLRNYELFGEPVLISTNGGITLWMGNAPGTDGSYMSVPDELASLPDNEQARILGAKAREYILGDPVGFAARSVKKLVLMYTNESIGVIWNAEGIKLAFGEGALTPLKRFTQVSWAALLLLAILGLISLARSHGVWPIVFSPIVVSVAFYSVVYSITVAQDRYHLSFAVQIALLGGAGIQSLQATWRQRTTLPTVAQVK